MRKGFDFYYWGIRPELLESCDETVREVGKIFELTDDDLQEVEGIARDEANAEIFKYIFGTGNAFTNLINRNKLASLIDMIHEKKGIPYKYLEYECDGEILNIRYKGELVADGDIPDIDFEGDRKENEEEENEID